MIDWAGIAEGWLAEQPHPRTTHLPANQQIKIGDYATAVKLATASKFAGPTKPEETAAFWSEFKAMVPPMTPQAYLQSLTNTAPLSFALHGRPPTLNEVAKLAEAAPREVRSYFEDLPDKDYPTVTAGQMAAKLMLANPFAQKHVGQQANKLQGAIFAHGNFNADQINSYYEGLNQPSDTQQIHGPGVPGATATGRSGQNIGDRQPTPGWGGGQPPVPPPDVAPKEDRAGGTQTGG